MSARIWTSGRARTVTVTKDGTPILDASPGMSKIPAAQLSLTRSIVDSAEDRVSDTESVVNSLRTELGTARVAATTSAVSLVENYSTEMSRGESSGLDESESARMTVGQLNRSVDRVAEATGLSRQTVIGMAADASVRGGLNKVVASAGIGGKVSYAGETMGKDQWDSAEEHLKQNNVVQEFPEMMSAAKNWSESSSDRDVKAYSDSFDSSLKNVESLEQAQDLRARVGREYGLGVAADTGRSRRGACRPRGGYRPSGSASRRLRSRLWVPSEKFVL